MKRQSKFSLVWKQFHANYFEQYIKKDFQEGFIIEKNNHHLHGPKRNDVPQTSRIMKKNQNPLPMM